MADRELTDAYFVNNERTTLEAHWKDKDGEYMQVINAESL